MPNYIEQISKLKSTLSEQQQSLFQYADNDEKRWQICCDMQKEMIELGTAIDSDENLHGSKIITWFEICCELCYRFAENKIEKNEFFIVMKHMLSTFEDDFAASLPESAYELSIAAIIKNERNILEWIEYHLLVGVSHFYIYDNESTDGLKEKLQPYIDSGIVTYIYFPGKYQQHPAYRHAIEHFKYETKWLAIIDGDEYIVPVKEGQSLPEVIQDIETCYKNQRFKYPLNIGAIGVNWRDYGTSGHKTPVDGLIIENYMYRAEDDYCQNVHIKSIYNPRTVSHIGNAHFGEFFPGWICLSEKGSYIPGPFFYDCNCEKIRINHYFSKSEEELVSKNKRGWPDYDLQRDDTQELHEATVNCNKIYDPIMERYIVLLKERLAN